MYQSIREDHCSNPFPIDCDFIVVLLVLILKVNGHPDLYSSNFPTKFGSSENISMQDNVTVESKPQNLPNIIEENTNTQSERGDGEHENN